MIRRLMYCPNGTDLYASPGNTVPSYLDSADLRPPSEWMCAGEPRGDWVMLLGPKSDQMREQGWKIHVSATAADAPEILRIVWHHLIPREIDFKVLRNPSILARRNGKYGDRSASGKFVTIYPFDDEQLELLVDELGPKLAGFDGPYILSDVRIRSGPLYLRYGGFRALVETDSTGSDVHCIRDPSGKLIPDVRKPTFHLPDWVPVPSAVADAISARSAGTMPDFPYNVEKALHFSNGGGVYLARRKSDSRSVLLREARPLAGVDQHNEDAVARLHREAAALERLSGISGIPALFEVIRGHEHIFLAREYSEGESLQVQAPRLRRELDAVRYAEWAGQISDALDEVVDAIATRGATLGDLHPGNIIVDGDRIGLIDMETASFDAHATQVHAAPGFAVPTGIVGPAIDRCARGLVKLSLYVPSTVLNVLVVDAARLTTILHDIAAKYPVSKQWQARVEKDLSQLIEHVPPSSVPHDSLTPTSVREGILAMATPDDPVRLFPGDAAQFFSPVGVLGFEFGAAGVLWALAKDTSPVRPVHVSSFVDRVQNLQEYKPGLLDGCAGISLTLSELGEHELAQQLVPAVDQLDMSDSTYRSGLAGIGLLHLHYGNESAAHKCLEHVVDRAAMGLGPGKSLTNRNPGLASGWSGGALLALRLLQHTGDVAYRDIAHKLIALDIEQFDTGVVEHELGGSLGTAMVLAELCPSGFDTNSGRSPVTGKSLLMDGISATQSSAAGLLHGSAGRLVAISEVIGANSAEWQAEQRRLHQMFTFARNGHPAFLGLDNYRFTADLGSGTAGIYAALTLRKPLPFL